MNQLRQIIKDKANKLNNPEDIIFHRQRQISALNNALAALESAKGAFGIMPPECVLVDLKTAWRELGLISGQTADERVIDMIFSTFCLGK
jgi:tRNA modification GTPase